MKKIVYNIFYIINLLFSGVMAFISACLLIKSLEYILNQEMNCYSMLGIPIHMFGVFLCIMIEVVLYYIRINIRKEIDFDEFGRSKKYNDYNKLSAKEKAKIDEQKLIDNERILDTNTLAKSTYKGSKCPDEDMKKLIGLNPVKIEIKKMAARMKYDKPKNSKNKPSMHMCFIGPPGTGKTTCARIMAGYLYKYGYIKKNKYIEINGSLLRGKIPGETAQKVIMLLQYARDGVLFIDEAYSIVDQYGNGQEAVSTLIKEMEDNRGHIVIILAGYDTEMKKFISSNSGIFSRIKYFINFYHYSNQELSDIFNCMANERGFYVPFESILKFQEKIEKEKKDRFFGNARTVRNMLEKSIDNHYYNMMSKKISQDKKYMICPEDI